MPKIRFASLLRPVWEHLLARLQVREITLKDLERLQDWVKTEPVAPDGDWFKDFGSFILCGTGELLKTVLARGMKPFGRPVT